MSLLVNQVTKSRTLYNLKNSTIILIIKYFASTIDLIDLLENIENNPYDKDELRISKIKNVLASRSCRISTMVGDALNLNEMKKIIQNLATLKSPWNCPHG